MKNSEIRICLDELPEDSVSGLLIVYEGIEMEVSCGENLWIATCPCLWSEEDDLIEGHGATVIEALKACHSEALKEPLISSEDPDDEDYGIT